MIFETASLTIDPARAEPFEAAVAACAPLFQAAKGCRSMQLEREIEDPSRYLLRIGWDSVEDHMIGFRESEAFQQWRATVGSFFVAAPVVGHHQIVVVGF